MNNLTTTLLNKHYHIDIEEWGKQGNSVPFDSGIEQRVVTSSIPSIELTISYNGLNFSDYEIMRTAYENNNSNTFIVDLNDSKIDLRPDLMTENASVWAFKDFQFKINAKDVLYSGKITLVTSVFFNFTEYQSLFDQFSSYVRSATLDESFINVLSNAQPHAAEFKYSNNAIFSNIGQSVRHARNKGGLKRAWTLNWLLTESNFLQLITFYRKNSGIMGEFGMPEFGISTGYYLPYADNDYIVDQDDYVFRVLSDTISNARFAQDSFQYQKRVDGLYQCRAEILEVKL